MYPGASRDLPYWAHTTQGACFSMLMVHESNLGIRAQANPWEVIGLFTASHEKGGKGKENSPSYPGPRSKTKASWARLDNALANRAGGPASGRGL